MKPISCGCRHYNLFQGHRNIFLSEGAADEWRGKVELSGEAP